MRAVKRITLVLIAISTLFLTLAVAGQACPGPCSDTTVVRAAPPASVQLFLPPSVAVGTPTTFTAEVLDQGADPVADGTQVAFTSSDLVTVDPFALTVNGVATGTLHAGVDVGLAVVTATAGSAVATGSLEVVPGPAGQLQLTVTANTRTVGESVELRVEALDSYGNAIGAGVLVSFTTTLGEIQPTTAETDAASTVTATLTSTQAGTAIMSAHSGDIHNSAIVRFVPGPTERITVTANPPAIPVDGATSQILATLTDRYGNRAGDGITVTFDSSRGTLSPVTATTVAGQATAVLRSGPIHGQSSVTVTMGAYSGTTTVGFLPADLQIQSTNTPRGNILPGTAVTYTISFENVGDAVARSVVITDTLPEAFVDVSFESSGATVTQSEGTSYIWDVEDLSPGEAGVITLHGYFDRHHPWPASRLVANVATIASATAEGKPEDNTTTAGNLIVTADVYIGGVIDDSGTDLRPGGRIRYQVFAGNYGPTPAHGLVITDTLPAHTRLDQETSYQVPGLVRLSEDAASVQVWQYDGAVEGPTFADFDIWLDIDPQAPGGIVLRNRIEVSTNTPESDQANNVSVSERRLSGINLEALLKGPDTILPGRKMTYTLRYTNTGTLPADDVVLTHLIPAGVSVVDVDRPPDRQGPDHIEWNLARVEPGEWRQIKVVGQVGTDVPAGRVLRSAVSVITASDESYTGDNTAEVNTQVVPDVPDKLTLDMAPTVTVGTTTPISVTIADQFGNPLDELTVTLTTTVGVVTPTVVTTVHGTASATFEVPTRPAEGAITAAFGHLSDSAEIVIAPGPPSDLQLFATLNQLPADGQSTAGIRVHVQDTYGNPVKDGTPVTFETDRGLLANGRLRHTVTTSNGIASTVLTAGNLPGTAQVTASAGSALGEVMIDFTPVVRYEIYLPLVER